jgi:lipoate-protein ligase A
MPTDRTHRAPTGVEGSGRHESGLVPVLPSSWQWWEDGARDGVTNMATDAALLATAQYGVGVWRWYGWSQPTVSFGRNERTAGRHSPGGLAAAGLAAVRRPTGGRALLHARELTYSVTVPLPAAVPWRLAYDAVNALLLAMLHELGVPARRAAARPPLAPDGPVCFDEPGEGELIVGGRKLVGSAVWRLGDAYLQHGSVLLHDDQARLPVPDGFAPPPPAATLATCLPGRSDEELRRAAYAASRRVLARGGTLDPFVPPLDWPAAFAAQQRHFASASWLWRR